MRNFARVGGGANKPMFPQFFVAIDDIYNYLWENKMDQEFHIKLTLFITNVLNKPVQPVNVFTSWMQQNHQFFKNIKGPHVQMSKICKQALYKTIVQFVHVLKRSKIDLNL